MFLIGTKSSRLADHDCSHSSSFNELKVRTTLRAKQELKLDLVRAHPQIKTRLIKTKKMLNLEGK